MPPSHSAPVRMVAADGATADAATADGATADASTADAASARFARPAARAESARAETAAERELRAARTAAAQAALQAAETDVAVADADVEAAEAEVVASAARLGTFVEAGMELGAGVDASPAAGARKAAAAARVAARQGAERATVEAEYRAAVERAAAAAAAAAAAGEARAAAIAAVEAVSGVVEEEAGKRSLPHDATTPAELLLSRTPRLAMGSLPSMPAASAAAPAAKAEPDSPGGVVSASFPPPRAVMATLEAATAAREASSLAIDAAAAAATLSSSALPSSALPSSSASSSALAAPTAHAEVSGGEASSANVAASVQPVATDAATAAAAATTAAAAAAATLLPEGWEMGWSTDYNHPYYTCAAAGITRWELPEGATATEGAAATAVPYPQQEQAEPHAAVASPSSVPLRAGGSSAADQVPCGGGACGGGACGGSDVGSSCDFSGSAADASYSSSRCVSAVLGGGIGGGGFGGGGTGGGGIGEAGFGCAARSVHSIDGAFSAVHRRGDYGLFTQLMPFHSPHAPLPPPRPSARIILPSRPAGQQRLSPLARAMEEAAATMVMARSASGRVPTGIQLLQDTWSRGGGGGGSETRESGSKQVTATRRRAVVLHCWKVAFANRRALRALHRYRVSRVQQRVFAGLWEASAASAASRLAAGLAAAALHDRLLVRTLLRAWRSEHRAFHARALTEVAGEVRRLQTAHALAHWRLISSAKRAQLARTTTAMSAVLSGVAWRGLEAWYGLVQRRKRLNAVGKVVQRRACIVQGARYLGVWIRRYAARRTMRIAFTTALSFHALAIEMGPIGLQQRLQRRVLAAWHTHAAAATADNLQRASERSAILLWRATVGTKVFRGWLSFVLCRRTARNAHSARRMARLTRGFSLLRKWCDTRVAIVALARSQPLLRGFRAFRVGATTLDFLRRVDLRTHFAAWADLAIIPFAARAFVADNRWGGVSKHRAMRTWRSLLKRVYALNVVSFAGGRRRLSRCLQRFAAGSAACAYLVSQRTVAIQV